MVEPKLVPGGGATEMALAHALSEQAKSVAGVQQWPYRAVAKALEVIPRTLLQNCGASTVRVLTALRVWKLKETRPPPAVCHLVKIQPVCSRVLCAPGITMISS